MDHPIELYRWSHPGVTVRLLLESVRCIDCDNYVPLGWIEFPNGVMCPKGNGWGHRIYTETLTNIKDIIMNEFGLQ